jgi:heme oxygenase (mycobilin-producing)
MTERLRVLVYASAPGDDPAAVARAYHQISRELSGTPGLCRNELLRSVHEAGRFVVMSEWQSLAAFTEWERGQAHRAVTAPLRPYQDHGRGPAFGIYEVAASYGPAGSAPAGSAPAGSAPAGSGGA